MGILWAHTGAIGFWKCCKSVQVGSAVYKTCACFSWAPYTSLVVPSQLHNYKRIHHIEKRGYLHSPNDAVPAKTRTWGAGPANHGQCHAHLPKSQSLTLDVKDYDGATRK